MMRCKVVLQFKQPVEDKGDAYLFFGVVYDGSEENKKFFKYTPGGQIQLNIVNKEICDQLTVGKEYYVDFTPAE